MIIFTRSGKCSNIQTGYELETLADTFNKIIMTLSMLSGQVRLCAQSIVSASSEIVGTVSEDPACVNELTNPQRVTNLPLLIRTKSDNYLILILKLVTIRVSTANHDCQNRSTPPIRPRNFCARQLLQLGINNPSVCVSFALNLVFAGVCRSEIQSERYTSPKRVTGKFSRAVLPHRN